MTLLADLRERGIELQPHGDKISCRPKDRMTADLEESLRMNEPAVLGLLRNAAVTQDRIADSTVPVTELTAEGAENTHQHSHTHPTAALDKDVVEMAEERAAILEYDGGLSRAEAERIAFEHLAPIQWRGNESEQDIEALDTTISTTQGRETATCT